MTTEAKEPVAPMPNERGRKVTLTQKLPIGNFGWITYDKAGEYVYTVREVLPDTLDDKNPYSKEQGLQYDTTIHNIIVNVVDQEGVLVAEVLYDEEDDAGDEEIPADSADNKTPITFTNRELVEKCDIEVVKQWKINGELMDNPTMFEPPEITVHLYRKYDMPGQTESVIEEIDSETMEAKAVDQAKPFKVTKDANGLWKLTIEGLDNYIEVDGKPIVYRYYIREDKVGIWNIESYFDGTHSYPGDGGSSSIEMKGGGTITVTNAIFTVSLPATGGPGTTIYTVSGLALIALALAMLLRRRRT